MADTLIHRPVVLDPGPFDSAGGDRSWNAAFQKALEARGLDHEFIFPVAGLFPGRLEYRAARRQHPRARFVLRDVREPAGELAAVDAELLTRRAERLREDLGVLDGTDLGRTLIFGHALDLSQVLGLALWTAALPEGRRPRLALDIHPSFDPPNAWIADGYRLVMANLPDHSRVRFFSATARMADFLSRATGRPAELLLPSFDPRGRLGPFNTLLASLLASKNWPSPGRREEKAAAPSGDPDLSLVVPARNAEGLLGRCLDSITRQQPSLTYECLVVDDGSTDRTADLIRVYARDFPQIRFIAGPAGGAGPARNLGLSQARGRYFWFVDSDDEIAPEAFSRLAPLIGGGADGPEALVFSYWRKLPGGLLPASSDNARHLFDRPEEEPGPAFTLRERPRLLATCTFPWNKVFRRDFIERHQIRFAAAPVHNDASFVVEALLKAQTIRLLPEALYLYAEERPDQEQISRIADGRRLAVREVFDVCDALMEAARADAEQWKYYLVNEFNALIWNMFLVGPELGRPIRADAVRKARRHPVELLERILTEDLLSPDRRAMFRSYLPAQFDAPRISVILDAEALNAEELKSTLGSLSGQSWPEEAYEVIVVGPAAGLEADIGPGSRRPHFRLAPPDDSAVSPFERGLRLARGRYVYLLNGPAVMRADFLIDGSLRLEDSRADILFHNFEYFSPSLNGVVYKEERNWPRLIEGRVGERALSAWDRATLFCGLESVGGLKFYRAEMLREMLADRELKGIFAHQALVDWACLAMGGEFQVSEGKLFHPLRGDERREQAKKTTRLDRMLAAAEGIRDHLERPADRPLRAVFLRLFLQDWAALPPKVRAEYGRGIPRLFPPLDYADCRLCARLFIDARISDALYALFMSRSRPRLARLARAVAGFILPRVIRPWRRWRAADFGRPRVVAAWRRWKAALVRRAGR